MSALSRDEIAHVAMLARIRLSDAELDRLTAQLNQIVDFVATIGEIDIDDIPPMPHPLLIINVTRVDEVRPSLSANEALAAAPQTQAGRFAVPRILNAE